MTNYLLTIPIDASTIEEAEDAAAEIIDVVPQRYVGGRMGLYYRDVIDGQMKLWAEPVNTKRKATPSQSASEPASESDASCRTR